MKPRVYLQIVEFTCEACGEKQRRVVLDTSGTHCTKCRVLLRFEDGLVRPGLAKCAL